MKSYFITATDTDAGKTYFSRLLVKALVMKKQKVAVFKPISAGCQFIDNVLVNEDAQCLMIESNCQQSLQAINPIAFLEPIAPHIAAKKNDVIITVEQISYHYKGVTDLNADFCITEGAGGWRLPLGDGLYLSNFAKVSKAKVILVVNMKLGCLNHAVLTYEAILADGLECVGWVANCQSEMPYLTENIAELSQLLPIPKIATLGFEPDLDKAINSLNLSSLI